MPSFRKKSRIKRLCKTFTLGLLILLVFASAALAIDLRNNDFIQVPKEETIKGPGFYSGQIVQIDGTVDGTAFSAGQEIRINGTVTGDLFVAGRNITIKGKVLGNVYCAAQYITVAGQVGGDIFSAGQDVIIAKEAAIQRDLSAAGRRIDYAGQVGRQFLAAGQDIYINGHTGDDVRLSAERLELLDNALIGGNLFYQSPNEAFISSGAKVSGTTDWKKTEQKQQAPVKKGYGIDFLGLLWGLAASLLIWFLVAIWRPRFWTQTRQQIGHQPLKTLGIGALALIVTPILAIFLLFTVVGLPLGIILALTYGVILYLAKIIAAVFIGYAIAERFAWPHIHKGVWLVLLGLTLIALLTKIPVLGFLFWLLVIFAGLGSVILVAFRPEPGNGEL